MDSALSYVLQTASQYGLPVIVAFIVGLVLGYVFFRSRSKDERDAISTISQADSELKERLETAESCSAQKDETITELRGEVDSLREERKKAESAVTDLSAQVDYWKSRAAGASSSSDGPLDNALDTFLD